VTCGSSVHYGETVPSFDTLREVMDAQPDLVETQSTLANLRYAMSHFATGVTVVTGLDAGSPVGFACQSFVSVSLDPALVLFCADHRGRAWPKIRQAGRFCVNVLHERQDLLCARFGSSHGDRFEGLDWRLSRFDTPVLPGVLMRVHADIDDVHEVGDHDVVVGRVLGLETGVSGRPMIFYRGRFGVDEPEPELSAPSPRFWGWDDYWD